MGLEDFTSGDRVITEGIVEVAAKHFQEEAH